MSTSGDDNPRNVARIIAQNASTTPTAIAIRTSDRAITFAELASRAWGISGPLAEVGRNQPIVLVVRDAIDVGVGVLAAAAVGRPAVIVSQDAEESSVLRLASSAGATDAICPPGFGRIGTLDLWSIEATHGTFEPVPRSPHEALALVSTSGSTESPRFIGLLEERFSSASTEGSVLRGLSPGMTVATTYSTASAPFGVIVRTLLAGASCSVLDIRRIPISQVMSLFAAHGAERVRLVPSVLRSLVGAGRTGPELDRVSTIGTVGERLFWQDVARLRELIPDSAVISNAYGLTETGLVTERIIRADEPLGTGLVGIGAPLPGRSVWIDDGKGNPASSGSVGEIVVEGRLGAVGFSMESLTDGTQRYHTGDLGSLLADGSLAYHGRTDRQSKINGHRVDLGAVEAAFRSLEGVLDVAVVTVERATTPSTEPTEAPRAILVAHVWVEDNITLESLRSEIARRLLAPATPAAIRIHNGPLPRLPAGKLDVNGLRTSLRVEQ